MLAIVNYKMQNIPDFSKSLWAKARKGEDSKTVG